MGRFIDQSAYDRLVAPVAIDDVRQLALQLPRSYEALVRDRLKFRVGRIVWIAFSRDEQTMGIAFPKDERAELVAAEPDVFMLPRQSEMRYNWVETNLAKLDNDELPELIEGAWSLCVPKFVRAAWESGPGFTTGRLCS